MRCPDLTMEILPRHTCFDILVYTCILRMFSISFADFIFTQQRYLDEDVKSYRQTNFAESTKATYKSHLRSFLRFCLYFRYELLPCTVETICRYIAFYFLIIFNITDCVG